MGGAGPYIDFSTSSSHYQHTKLPQLSEEESEGIWRRAQGFIDESVVLPLTQVGWKEVGSETGRRMFTSATMDKTLVMPTNVLDLTDVNNKDFWSNSYGGRNGFHAKYVHRDSYSMYIEAASPCLVDYIYLLQIIIPGLITLIRENDFDEYEEEVIRILPNPKWIEEREEKLVIILGSNERFHDVLSAARDTSRAFKRSAWGFDYGKSDSESEMQDFTACDKECGYCGKCEY